jgi:hypothetical protein
VVQCIKREEHGIETRGQPAALGFAELVILSHLYGARIAVSNALVVARNDLLSPLRAGQISLSFGFKI